MYDATSFIVLLSLSSGLVFVSIELRIFEKSNQFTSDLLVKWYRVLKYFETLAVLYFSQFVASTDFENNLVPVAIPTEGEYVQVQMSGRISQKQPVFRNKTRNEANVKSVARFRIERVSRN